MKRINMFVPRPASAGIYVFTLCCLMLVSGVSMMNASVREKKWKVLFNGKDLNGWTVRGDASWTVRDGVMIGEGGRGHIYAGPVISDLEIKGEFRITDLGKGANGGLYFRAQEPSPNPNGFPVGYEAQICHHQDAHTGWLWRPGKPTGRANALLTKDEEWFEMRVKAVGAKIQIWVKDSLVMDWSDSTYTAGRFAVQCHNPGMRIEARKILYRSLD